MYMFESKKKEADVYEMAAFSKEIGVSVDSLTFDGGHEMTQEFLDAAGRALARWDVSPA